MCPITGCGRGLWPAPTMDAPLCSTHWFSVPPDLRLRVYWAWRALQADLANEEKHRAYQAARDEAVAAV